MIDFGREVCGDLAAAESHEWLCTNGLGGYASGTIAGLLTRRYHGLLVAALAPPVGRTLLVAKLEETAAYGDHVYALGANRWRSGAVEPRGYVFLERFRLDGTIPVWTFALADALLEKRVWMEPGANVTWVRYEVARGSGDLVLELRALVNHRDHHAVTSAGSGRFRIETTARGLAVHAAGGATPLVIASERAPAAAAHEWYRDFDLARDRERGLEDREDHLHAGTFHVLLRAGEAVTIVASAGEPPAVDGAAALERRRTHDRRLAPADGGRPTWIGRLALAADQFIARRALADDPDGCTIIAGYPWFGDWGRDTMIALPGLALATGRAGIARRILTTFARFASEGLLPNRFPDQGEPPEYNTADAALWYVEAVRAYVETTGDLSLLREVYPTLEEIVAWHVKGTRHGIGVDSSDGLLHAGGPGMALTWMDARVDGVPVTPRTGKPVEVNALWLNALRAMTGFARRLGRHTTGYERLARQAGASFARFWNTDAGYCFDVLDGPAGHDPALRPNQLFAAALPESALTPSQQRAVVDACARRLLTTYGLRTLSPDDPAYVGRYRGDVRARDRAYHQGTAWAWLLGPFALAHVKAYGDRAAARAYLEPIAHHLGAHGLGTVAEIFDGDPPHAPAGCIAQAWSVAEVLRAWTALAPEGAGDAGSPT
jgi:predicted glycogen debranching enzyme